MEATQAEPSVTTHNPLSPSVSGETAKTVTIGTRRSKLARVQTDLVLAALQKEYPSYTFKIHAMDPLGDRDKITALYSFNAKSLWTHELEALLEVGELDLIVHSLKGLPSPLPALYPLREFIGGSKICAGVSGLIEM